MTNVVTAYPDDQMGHQASTGDNKLWEAFGITTNTQYYPVNQADLSALGTKVVQLKPSAFAAAGGGPLSDGLALKAVRQAGYEGQLFSTSGLTAAMMAQLVPTEMLEGFINGAYPLEFDPPPTQVAKDFKAAWIARTAPSPPGAKRAACR